MNPSSPWVRVLQVLAAAQGLAILVLGIAWWRVEPPPPAPTGAVTAATRGGDGAAAPVQAETAPIDAGSPAAMPSPAATEPTATALLYGSVRRADGSPLTEGVLWLSRDGQQVGTASLRGPYVFAGLTPGVHQLRSRIDDELPVERDVLVQAPRTRLDLQLAPRWCLTVNAVTPEGAPLVESMSKIAPRYGMRMPLVALALAEPLTGDLPAMSRGVEGGLGTFRGGVSQFFTDKVMPKAAIGVLALPPDQPVHVALLLRNALVAQQAVPAGQAEVTFTLTTEAVLAKTAKVRLRTVDESGAPMADTQVSVGDGQSSSTGQKTGADGRIEFTNVSPGRVDLSFWSKDLRGPQAQIDVAAGEDLDIGDVTLRTTFEVELDFEHFGGSGSIRSFWLDAPVRPGWHTKESHHSATNGRSQKVRLHPGRHALFATSKAGVALEVIDAQTYAGKVVRLQLTPGAPLRVRGDVGVLPWHVAIARNGIPALRRELSRKVDFTFDLPPGDYEATITRHDGTVTRRAIALPRGGAEITLP